MPDGFFHGSELLSNAPVSKIARCGACKLYRNGCTSPKMAPTGKGKKNILIVGEAPGEEEDKQGRQFCGPTGKLLEDTLRKIGIDMRRDCYLTNANICRPLKNATPTNDQISYCRPYLTKAIEEFNPNVIIPLGAVAVKSLIGGIWKEDIGAIGRWVGFNIPCQEPNAWVCPTYHPSFIKRALDKPDGKVHQLLFEQHLERAITFRHSKPHKVVPNYDDSIEIIYNVDDAANRILKFVEGNRPIAFDFETNALKPDSDDTIIVCASVSDGIDTIAFPWEGSAIDAMKKLLRSSLPKFGFNIKFEQRWLKRKLGYEVKNWVWCGMTGAHWLDNRKGITGLKFQAFIMLGAKSYDDKIKPFLKPSKGMRLNAIHKIAKKQLFRYCAFDSLLEWLVAKKQMKLGNYQIEGV